jgi:hypothetical protein
MGPGEECLDDHGVGAGGEVVLRRSPSAGRCRNGPFPARGAGELESSKAAPVAVSSPPVSSYSLLPR